MDRGGNIWEEVVHHMYVNYLISTSGGFLGYYAPATQ